MSRAQPTLFEDMRTKRPASIIRESVGCSRFRQILVRRWAPGPLVAWLLTNPSVADDLRDDPTSWRLPNGHTVPVCSTLYARCWRAWQAMGGKRLVTYTLATEPGASLRGAGWRIVGETEPFAEGKGWTTRPGREWQPVNGQLKIRWEAA